jgi:hypothetical protein
MQIKQLVGHFHINLEGKTGKFFGIRFSKNQSILLDWTTTASVSHSARAVA